MKIIRNINNNVSLCKDSENVEVVIFGKGVGFLKVNEEVPLSNIIKLIFSSYHLQTYGKGSQKDVRDILIIDNKYDLDFYDIYLCRIVVNISNNAIKISIV